MKKLMTVVSFLFFCSIGFSQDLVIKSGSKGSYLEHKVAAKEGLFPIGRMYNVHPRHIANFNGIDFNKGLPVYYVAEKESLATISVKSKAQIGDLRGWNNLTADNISAGTKLIVGFLITNEMQDKVVTITPKTVVVEESVSNVKKQEASENKQPVNETKKDVVVEESVSNVKKAEEQKQQTEPPLKETPPEVKEEPKKTEPKKTEPPVVKPQGS